MSGWEWHRHNDTGPTAEGTKGARVHGNVCVCVWVYVLLFLPHRIHLKIQRLLHWWKLLPFVLTVSASGGGWGGVWYEGGEERVRVMWAGVQIIACFVTAYVYQGKLTERSFYFTVHLYRQNKKRKQRGSSKRLHARRARPLATVSHHDLLHSWLRAIHPLVIKGCMRRGTHMGICYFFLHRRHALARPVFSPLWPASVVCLLVKSPSVQLCHRAPLEWNFFLCFFFSTFKLRPHGVGDANSLLSVNFTSLAFVGPVYNRGGKCEINPAQEGEN